MSNDTWQGCQPRYKAYCLAHVAASVEEMFARDREKYPGGMMAGFINWISTQWNTWEQLTGFKKPFKSPEDHAVFDLWLKKQT